MFLSIFCGSPVLQNYSSIVFEEAGSSDPQLSAIIMIIVQVCATLIASSMVDNLGRRMLLIFSACGTTLGFVIMAAYQSLKDTDGKKVIGLEWVPIASISFTVFLAYIGLLPLVFVIIMEVLPAKVNTYLRHYDLKIIFFSLKILRFVKCMPPVAYHSSAYLCSYWLKCIHLLLKKFICILVCGFSLL